MRRTTAAEGPWPAEARAILGLGPALGGARSPADIAAAILSHIRPLLTRRVTALIVQYDEATDASWTIAADGPRAGELTGHWPTAVLPAELRARRLERREALILPDTRDGGGAWEVVAATGRGHREVRFVCSFPLVSQDGVVGFLDLSSERPRELDSARLQVLRGLTQLVAGPLHAALLLAQARAQEERDALVNRVVQRVGANPDLDEVLGATVEEIGQAQRVSRAVVWLGESDAELRLAHEWNADGVPPIGAGVPLRTVATPTAELLGRTVAIADASTDPRLAAAALGGREAYARAGIVSALATPLTVGGRLLGVLALHQLERSRVWAEADVRQIEAVARELAVAVANARNYDDVRRRLARIRTLNRLNRLVSSSLELDEVLPEIARAAAELTGAVVASFWLVDEAAQTLELRVMSDETLDADQTFRTTVFGRGAAGWVAQYRRPMIVDDVFADGRTAGLDWWRRHGLRSSYTVPVVHSGSLLAVLSMNGREPFRVGPDEQEVLESFIAQAAVAIRNAALYLAVRRNEAQLQAILEAERAANEQLERLHKAKSDFVSVVSHEFRTPLTGIQAFSELMRDEDFAVEEMKEFAADINREAERLNRMIGEMLDLDRMESGRMTLHPEAVDLGSLAAEVVANARANAPRHTLRLELDPALPALPGDRDKLTQVVVNLLGNAIKYSPDGGAVTVGARAEGTDAHLWVRDQGVGMPPEALEVVFERYARVESGPHRYIKGTGLGLPIVRQIAELHGGRAWAESEAGRGATFHVTLPLAGPSTGA